MNQTDIEDMIQCYLEAEKTLLQGKSITFNGQSMTMENLGEIQKGRMSWERRLVQYQASQRGRSSHKMARFV